MASGVTVADKVCRDFLEIKKGKNYRYIIFHIAEDKVIDVESYGNRDATYQDFLDYLTQLGPNECRYAVYDFEYEHQCQGTSESTKKQKLFLMSWCPDTAKIKMKMLYSSSFDAIKSVLDGVGKYVQATDLAEASYDSVLEKMRATDRS